MEMAQNLDLPIIAVNLNQQRNLDARLCPAILRDRYVVHVCFKAKVIHYALERFPDEYKNRNLSAPGNRVYGSAVYTKLGL
jgi:hypothetical protein